MNRTGMCKGFYIEGSSRMGTLADPSLELWGGRYPKQTLNRQWGHKGFSVQDSGFRAYGLSGYV